MIPIPLNICVLCMQCMKATCPIDYLDLHGIRGKPKRLTKVDGVEQEYARSSALRARTWTLFSSPYVVAQKPTGPLDHRREIPANKHPPFWPSHPIVSFPSPYLPLSTFGHERLIVVAARQLYDFIVLPFFSRNSALRYCNG